MDSQTSQRLLDRVRQAKEKQAEVDPRITQAMQVARDGLKQEAMGDVGKVMLFGAGAGAAGRGVLGLARLLNRNIGSPPSPPQRTVALPLPYPAEPKPDEKKRLKAAGYLGDLLGGDKATTKEGIPAYYPAMVMGGLAAGYGGWKTVDGLLDKRRREDVSHDLESARSQFREALLSQYSRPIKQASDQSELEKLGTDLDRLYDEMEKRAFFDSNTAGQGIGMYGTYAALTSLLAGNAAYSAAKKNQRRAILEKAVKQRARRQHQVQPEELYATPVPVATS